MLTSLEKQQLQEILKKYQNFNNRLSKIEQAQEDLKIELNQITDECSLVKEEESILLTELTKKYGREFSVNEILEMIK